MSDSPELKWGQTPWDNLTRDELLREIQRHHAALISLAACLRMERAVHPEHPYWSAVGTGGRALGMADVIQDGIEAKYGDREPAFRTFFRYATDLLFPSLDDEFRQWKVCDSDGTMLSPGGTCIFCGAPMRPLRWEDLKPADS